MKRTVYIAGKITGLPKEEVQSKFNNITSRLTDMGYTVVNPAVSLEEERNWRDAVRSDIKKMLECDEVHLLPDWQESRGAQLERDIALRLGMQVVYH
jgi:hypothetical protein